MSTRIFYYEDHVERFGIDCLNFENRDKECRAYWSTKNDAFEPSSWETYYISYLQPNIRYKPLNNFNSLSYMYFCNYVTNLGLIANNIIRVAQ